MEQPYHPIDNCNPLGKSLHWSALITVLTAGGSLLWMLLLTRLIAPSDFASSALALAVVGLVLLLVQNGIPGAIIFQQEKHRETLSVLFWNNLLLGLAGSGVICLSAYGIGTFFGDMRLPGILWSVAWLPVLVAAGAVYKSIHLRDLSYRTIAGAEWVAFSAGVGTSAWLVFAGYGYWAAIAQWAVRYAAEALFYILTGLVKFLPGFAGYKLRVSALHRRFAAGQWTERLTMYLNANIDTLLVGKLLGAEALGVYDVFKRLIARPASIAGEWIDRFAFPLMAGSKHPATIFFANVRLLSMLLAPMAVLGIVAAAPLLRSLTGDAWQGELRTFQWLTAAVVVGALSHPWDGLLAAGGRLGQLSVANIGYALLLVAGIWIGSAAGLEGVAAAQAVLAPVWLLLGYRLLLQKQTGQGIAAFFYSPVKWGATAIACAIPAWIWLQIKDTQPAIPALLAAGLTFGACYGWAIWKSGIMRK